LSFEIRVSTALTASEEDAFFDLHIAQRVSLLIDQRDLVTFRAYAASRIIYETGATCARAMIGFRCKVQILQIQAGHIYSRSEWKTDASTQRQNIGRRQSRLGNHKRGPSLQLA
jgi:hypothetical protein